jgi:hypothetical protein
MDHRRFTKLANRIEVREPVDPWRGRQPRFEKLVFRRPAHFELVGRLSTGEPITVRLGPLR